MNAIQKLRGFTVTQLPILPESRLMELDRSSSHLLDRLFRILEYHWYQTTSPRLGMLWLQTFPQTQALEKPT